MHTPYKIIFKVVYLVLNTFYLEYFVIRFPIGMVVKIFYFLLYILAFNLENYALQLY